MVWGLSPLYRPNLGRVKITECVLHGVERYGARQLLGCSAPCIFVAQECTHGNHENIRPHIQRVRQSEDGLALKALFSHLPALLAKICRAEKGKCAHRDNCVHQEYEQSSPTGYWVVFRTKLVTYYAVVNIGRRTPAGSRQNSAV